MSMERRQFISGLVGTAAWPFGAIAQSKAIPIIAIVGSLDQEAIDTVKDGLREFSFVNGETIIVVGSPASAASPEEVSKTVSNFISQNIDLIFASEAVPEEQLKPQRAQSQLCV